MATVVNNPEDCAVHLNSVQLIGRLSKRPELRYTESGTPFCSLVVACDEVGPGAKIFTTWIPVDITGKYAQQSAVDLEEGDEVQISGKLKYKSVVDKQTQQKTSKLIVSTWGIQQRTPAPGYSPGRDR
jgi:single-strand DNA-binding protein